MLQLRLKQMLALFLCTVLIRPTPIVAAPGAVLGSVTPRGVVTVGDIRIPGMSALFSGDNVQTRAGSALIQYQEGAKVVLGIESQASFSPSRVELQKGQMSFSSVAGGPQFVASTLRIEPVGPKSAANVTYMDHKATVLVTEGSFRVVDPSGAQLASLRAGEMRLFEEVSAAAPGPPAAAAPPAVPPSPQITTGGSSRTWLLALGIGIVGTSLGIAGIVRASDADDRADAANQRANQAQSEAAEARALAASATSQNAALQTAVNNLRTQVTSLQTQLASQAANQAAVNAQLGALLAVQQELAAIQAESQAIQNQINDLLIELATLQTAGTGATTQASSPSLTIQEIIDRLRTLRDRLGQLGTRFTTAVNALNRAVENIRRVLSPT